MSRLHLGIIFPLPYRLMEPRFPLGEVYTSATTAARLADVALLQIFHRHHCGDRGGSRRRGLLGIPF